MSFWQQHSAAVSSSSGGMQLLRAVRERERQLFAPRLHAHTLTLTYHIPTTAYSASRTSRRGKTTPAPSAATAFVGSAFFPPPPVDWATVVRRSTSGAEGRRRGFAKSARRGFPFRHTAALCSASVLAPSSAPAGEHGDNYRR